MSPGGDEMGDDALWGGFEEGSYDESPSNNGPSKPPQGKSPPQMPIGSIAISAWLDEDGQYRYHIETTGSLRTDQGVGLLELAKHHIIRQHFGEE